MENQYVKINIYDNKDGNVEIVGTHDLKISAMKPFQFMRVTKIVKDFIQNVSTNEDIKATLSQFFSGMDEDSNLMEIIQTAGADIIGDGANAISYLLDVAPETALEIISVLANINTEQLAHQEMETFFDITDKVVEVNDFNKVIERVKKLSNSLQKQTGWKFRQAQATAASPKLTPPTA